LRTPAALQDGPGVLNLWGRDRMNLKLYVGNLPFSATEEDLKKLFSEAGTVQSVKVVIDAYSGRPRGFGFVEMASEADAEKAVSLLNGKTMMERALIVSEAKPQKQGERPFKGR